MQPDPSPSPPPARRPPDWLPHALGLLALALLLALLVGLSVWQERSRQHQHVAAAAQNLARLLEARVADALARADLLLQAAAGLAHDADSQGAASPGLAALAAAGPDVHDLRRFDANGRWRWRLGPAKPGQPPDALARTPTDPTTHRPTDLPTRRPTDLQINPSTDPSADPSTDPSTDLPPDPHDSEEFQRARAPSTPGLIITGPRRQAPEGPWLLVLSRAVRSADGRFAGLVSVHLPVARFDALLGDIDLGEHGAATLRTAALALVYHRPGPTPARLDDTAAIGSTAVPAALREAARLDDTAAIGSTAVPAALREAITRNPLAGELDAAAAADGSARINAYRQVLGYPLVLVVALAEHDVADGWRAAPLAAALLALATLAVAGLATALLYRTNQRERSAAQRQWAAFVGASGDAIISETLDGVLTHWNPAAERLFGHSAAQMVGQSIQGLVPPEHRDQLAQAVAQMARGEPVAPFDTERLCRDGRRISVRINVAPVMAPDGRVIGSTRTARDTTPHKAMQAELHQLALHDPLTQLPNRRLLLDRLGRAQQTSKRQGAYAALLVLVLELDVALEVEVAVAVAVAVDLAREPALVPAGSTLLDAQPGQAAEAGERGVRGWPVPVVRCLAAALRETDTVARLSEQALAVVCENLGASALLAGQRLAALEAKLHSALAPPMALGIGPGSASVVYRLRVGRRLFIGSDDAPAALVADADRAVPRPPPRPGPAGGAPQDDVNEDEDDY